MLLKGRYLSIFTKGDGGYYKDGEFLRDFNIYISRGTRKKLLSRRDYFLKKKFLGEADSLELVREKFPYNPETLFKPIYIPVEKEGSISYEAYSYEYPISGALYALLIKENHLLNVDPSCYHININSNDYFSRELMYNISKILNSNLTLEEKRIIISTKFSEFFRLVDLFNKIELLGAGYLWMVEDAERYAYDEEEQKKSLKTAIAFDEMLKIAKQQTRVYDDIKRYTDKILSPDEIKEDNRVKTFK